MLEVTYVIKVFMLWLMSKHRINMEMMLLSILEYYPSDFLISYSKINLN